VRPGALDYVLLVVLLLGAIFDWRWYWPRCVRSIRAKVPGARMRMYRILGAAEWAVTLFVLGLWIAKARPWSALWLGPVEHLRLGLGLLFAAIVIAIFVRNTKNVLGRPKSMAYVREKIGYLEPLLAETEGERRAFWFVSITAGICEEIIFRGFVMWCIGAWTGLILAVILSSVFFGFGHIYQGVSRTLPTALAGLALALIVVATGSLWPAIIIHAALDANSGELVFRVRRSPSALTEPAPSPTS
jgi:uncharacterized protein